MIKPTTIIFFLILSTIVNAQNMIGVIYSLSDSHEEKFTPDNFAKKVTKALADSDVNNNLCGANGIKNFDDMYDIIRNFDNKDPRTLISEDIRFILHIKRIENKAGGVAIPVILYDLRAVQQYDTIVVDINPLLNKSDLPALDKIIKNLKTYFYGRDFQNQKKRSQDCLRTKDPICCDSIIQQIEQNSTCWPDNPEKQLLIAKLYLCAGDSAIAREKLDSLRDDKRINHTLRNLAELELIRWLKQSYFLDESACQHGMEWWGHLDTSMKKALSSGKNGFKLNDKLGPADPIELCSYVFGETILSLNIHKDSVSVKELRYFTWLQTIMIIGNAGLIKDWGEIKNISNLVVMIKEEYFKEETINNIVKQTGWERKNIRKY